MASTPTFLGTACVGRATVSTANTNRDGTTGTYAATTWYGAGTGTPDTDFAINRIVIHSTSDPADSIVTMFAVAPGGGASWIVYEFDIGNPATGSTTVGAFHGEYFFSDWKFPAETDLKFGLTVAPTAGTVEVTVFCERA